MKQLTIITMAPEQTQGDASATLKLIHALLDANADNAIKIHWVIYAEKAQDSKDFYSGFMTAAINRGVSVTYADLKNDIFTALESVVTQTDLFVLFSAYAGMEKINEFVQKHAKQMLTIYEYNSEDSFGQDLSIVATGFGEHNLGIFIDNCEVNYAELRAESKLDKILIDSLGLQQIDDTITADSIAKYTNANDLYFGYFNVTGRASNGSVNPINYMLICVNLALKKAQHNIDLVVRLKNDSEFKKFATEIAQKYPNQFQAIDYINQTGNMQTISLANTETLAPGGIPKRIRILNLFPMNPALFKLLLHISQPFKALTGNESFVEGLAANAIVFYQTMYWKHKLFTKFHELCCEYLGENSVLSRYYSSLSDQTDIQKTADFIMQHEIALQEQARTLWALLQQNHNLITNLVPLLRAVVQNPESIEDLIPRSTKSKNENLRPRIDQIKAIAPDLPILSDVKDMEVQGYIKVDSASTPSEKIELNNEQILNLIFKRCFRLVVCLNTEPPNIPDCYAVPLYPDDRSFFSPYRDSEPLIGYIPKQIIDNLNKQKQLLLPGLQNHILAQAALLPVESVPPAVTLKFTPPM